MMIDNIIKSYLNRIADYPKHPDTVVIGPSIDLAEKDKIKGYQPRRITEKEVWTFYDGIKPYILKDLKGKNLFVRLKTDTGYVYVRHPFSGKTEFIRINNEDDFDKYNTGRIIEFHTTMPSMCPVYIVDFDAAGDWDKTKKITAEVADELNKLPEVKKVEIRYTGKRGFHILGWLKEKKPVDKAREDLKNWLGKTFGNRNDLIVGESPRDFKGALGVSPMKLNGGQVALWSLRVTGLCCVEVPRDKLMSFKREDASLEKTYKRLTGKTFIPEERKIMAERIVKTYLFESRSASYDYEKIAPGYKGRFLIHDHKAERAGRHFDLRLEFPVKSLSRALKNYQRRTSPESEEPVKEYPDKPGTVYRSFVIKKHKIPAKKKKLFIVPVEDHPIAYGSFEGEITKGYGKGTVTIWDKGTYEIIDNEGDKKYTLNFKGDKLNGIYTLIKYNQGYLWIKSSEKTASAIDYTRPVLSPQIFDLTKDPPIMKEDIRRNIIGVLFNALEKEGIKKPLKWITGLFLSGSLTGYNYREDSDIDIDILYDPVELKKENPELSELSDEDLHEYIKKIIYAQNDKALSDTSHTFSYMLLRPGDIPIPSSIYDIFKNKWLKDPVKIPEDFNPDTAFKKQREIANKIGDRIDVITGRILRTIASLKVIDQYEKNWKKPVPQRIVLIYQLQVLCKELDNWYNWIWSLQEKARDPSQAYYPAFNFSSDWEEKTIIFKYLSRYGYTQCIRNLYRLLKDDPYLKLVDKFIPD